MKRNYSHGVRSIPFFVVLLLLTFVGINSCKKNKSPETSASQEVLKPQGTDRLLSVANVYYTPDGKKAEAWFYETPLVYEFSASGIHAKDNFAALKFAKENNVPVNVRLVAHVEDLIDVVIPATAEQIESFKAEVSKRENAEEVLTPENPGLLPNDPSASSKGTAIATSLISLVPNTTVLNTIFNTVKSQCCKLPGVFLYGQCIPFQFVADGCYARAHKTRQIIESYYGYASYKVFNYACSGSGTLAVNSNLWGNNCCVHWWYHVASYVNVYSSRSGSVSYVIDPSMFVGPVTISSWIAAQKNVNCGYGGDAQGHVYTASNGYGPSSLNSTTCSLVTYVDNTYTAADATCSAYSKKQGCSF